MTVKKMAIDLGNGSMKFVGGESLEQLKYVQIPSLATTESDDNNHVVALGEEQVHFGVGEPLIEQDKTKRKYIGHSLLLAAYEIYGSGKHEINLGLTLPISLYKITKETFKASMEQYKSLEGKVNGEAIKVTLKEISVFAEGLNAFIALASDLEKEDIAFIDLGHRTTDVILANSVTENGKKKWKLVDNDSFQVGGYDLLNSLRGALYEPTSTLFEIHQIEHYLAGNGMIGSIKIKDYFQSCNNLIEELIRKMGNRFNDLHHRKIYIVGGASPIFESVCGLVNVNSFENTIQRVFSNAVGSYMKLADL